MGTGDGCSFSKITHLWKQRKTHSGKKSRRNEEERERGNENVGELKWG